MLYLGIDAGGSTCRAQLEDQKGVILGRGKAGPANLRLGIATAMQAIKDAFGQTLKEANLTDISPSEISAAVGIAGISNVKIFDEFKAQPFFSMLHRIVFASDAEIANHGAHAGKDGGTVIVGTGSIGIAKLGRTIHTIGGYGFPISDLGSGANIGLSAVQNMLRARDGLITSCALTDAIFNIFDNDPLNAIAAQDSMTAGDYAKFAPIVVSHAQKGDVIATHILQQSATHIEQMIRAIDQLNVPRIALTGGLGTIMMQWLDPSVKVLLSEPLGDALQGAIKLAKSHE